MCWGDWWCYRDMVLEDIFNVCFEIFVRCRKYSSGLFHRKNRSTCNISIYILVICTYSKTPGGWDFGPSQNSNPKSLRLGMLLDRPGPSGSHTHIKLRTPKLNLHIANGGRTSRFHHLRYTISSIYVFIFIYTDKHSPTIQRNNTPAKITSNIYIPIYIWYKLSWWILFLLIKSAGRILCFPHPKPATGKSLRCCPMARQKISEKSFNMLLGEWGFTQPNGYRGHLVLRGEVRTRICI